MGEEQEYCVIIGAECPYGDACHNGMLCPFGEESHVVRLPGALQSLQPKHCTY